MTLIEIAPRNGREHRRMIRQMTKGAFERGRMPMDPIAKAWIEIGATAVSLLMMAAFVVMCARWWAM